MRILRTPGAPTIDTSVNFWPAFIDMLVSILMFFLLTYFIQNNIKPESLAAAIAEQKRDQMTAALSRTFQKEIDRHEVALTADVNLLQITFGEQILFQLGHYDLQPPGQEMLRRLASVVHSVTDGSAPNQLYEQIQIEGHTDSRPMDRPTYPHDNWELSSARSLEVLKFLTQNVDPPLDPKTMSANGYADTRPASKERLDMNRRIEVRIYFSGKNTGTFQKRGS